MLSRDELQNIPLRYRLLVKILLKLPNPHLPFVVVKRLPEFEGILWALIVPIFISLYFIFDAMFIIPSLSLLIGFPLNIIIALIIPTIILSLFLRIQLERTILLQRNLHEPSKEWEVSKRVKELVELFEKQHNKKKS